MEEEPEDPKITSGPIMLTGSSSLKARLSNTDSYEDFDTAQALLFSENEKDREVGASTLKKIAEDNTHPKYFHAAQALFGSYKQENKEAGTITLITIAKDNSHPYTYCAKGLLRAENKVDKEARTRILKEKFEFENNPSQKLQIAAVLGNIDHLIQVALDASQPRDLRLKALCGLSPSDIDDERLIVPLIETIGGAISAEDLPIQDRLPLVCWLENADSVSEEIYLSLLPAFSSENKDVINSSLLGNLLMLMLQSEYSGIQDQAETFFLANPLRFMISDSFLPLLPNFLEHSEERKRNIWLQRICEAFQSSSYESKVDFDAACLVLRMTSQEQFVIPAKRVFLKMVDTLLYEEMFTIKRLLLYVKDEEVKEKIVASLFNLAQREGVAEDAFSNDHTLSALLFLLKRTDEKTREKTIPFCQKLIDSVQSEQVGQNKDALCRIGLALNSVDEGKALAKQIFTLLHSEYNQILSQPKTWYAHRNFLKLFIRLGDKTQQLEIYNLLKTAIIAEDEDEEENEEKDVDEFEDAVYILENSLGPDHAWTQDIIELVTKRANSDHPNSAFGVHKQLLEKVRRPVDHHLPRFQLDDERWVTFNLKTLQTRRQTSFIPMKHTEFMSLVEQLVDEAEKKLEELKLLAEPSLANTPRSAIDLAKKSYFRFLLDEDGKSKETKKVSLISRKLRQILVSAKNLQGQDLEEKGPLPSQGLSERSQLILALLNNVLTCPTGKDDGIDQTYRLLTKETGKKELGASEEQMEHERLTEDLREFFMEEMRCMREGLLNGEGPVVRALLDVSITKIDEPPHQKKYLQSLLGPEIGTFQEDERVPFDPNGGAVLQDLRNCSKQEILDTLYKHHTPQKVISYFHDQFESKGLTGKVEGKYNTSKIMSELLNHTQLQDQSYVVFDDDFIPQNLTPLAVAEFLIRTGILDVVESH